MCCDVLVSMIFIVFVITFVFIVCWFGLVGFGVW